LIGDGASFVEHVRERYEKVLAMTKETQKKRTQDNMSKINDEMRKKKEGLTLGEKIEVALGSISERQCVTLIDDAFITPVLEKGNEYFTRYSDFLREDGRKRDIVDDVMVAKKV